MLLDSCFLIDYHREQLAKREGKALSFLKNHSEEKFYISNIAAIEFLEGFEDLKSGEAVLRPFNWLNLDEKTTRCASRIRRKLRQLGKPIGDFDVVIAATALAKKQILVTNNLRHFEKIEGLELISY